ncbi:MAG: AAA family ATPase [Planctomycetes bacterium]|nr:AAA family ATPase [Planctomycetota bacterium]
MDAYEHFKLNKPPFEPRPDVHFFFDAPNHAEVLATVQYAVHAGKGCCVVVGESGCGKSLLARMIAAAVARTTSVLWIHGGGQPANETGVSVYPWPPQDRERGKPALQTTLAAETHAVASCPEPPLLIVDCADELSPQGWADVIAWFTNEICRPKPANVLLFGLPRLLDLLASPELVRLQGRVFRACQLEPLTPELSQDYIRARVATAGGDARRIFSDEIIERISRVAKGNPALLNQLCDNALLEAFGEGRERVTSTDVGNALHAMLMGRLQERAALPAPAQPLRPALPPVRGSLPWYPSAAMPAAAAVADEPISPARIGEIEDSIDMRLKQFADRLSQALEVIHEAEDESGEELFPSEESGLRTVAAESTTI